MNLIDMKTVLLSYLISNAICALVITSLWIQNRRRFVGLGFWLADFVMQFLAVLLVALRGVIPDLLSMTVSNVLVIGGTILLYIGLEHYVGKRSAQWHNIFLLAVFIPFHIYFVFYPNLPARNLLFSSGLLVIFAQIAWLMLRRVEAKRRSLTRVAGVLFVIYGLVSLVRIVLDLTIPSDNDFFHSNVYETSIILCYQMLFIILTFNLFLMVNQHLLRDLERETTAHKRAEAATIRLNAELKKRVAERTAEMEASNRELESLSYTIAHDMRSPVRAMVGYAAMLQESKGEKLDEEGRVDLEIIHASAIRLGQLIDDFLAYLHLGRVLIKKQPIRMTDLVQHVKDEILSKNPQRQIQFSCGTLPDCEADLFLLEQVWTQLIGNAVKFTRLREVAEIEIGADEKDGKPCYFIHDNGIGFNMKYAEKIFGLFQHLNPLDDYGGTGAGLAIARRILERHGGQIWAKAEVDKGATFYFTLEQK